MNEIKVPSVAMSVTVIILLLAAGALFASVGLINVKPTEVAVEVDKLAGKVKDGSDMEVNRN